MDEFRISICSMVIELTYSPIDKEKVNIASQK